MTTAPKTPSLVDALIPVVSVIYGYSGFTIRKIDEAPEEAVLA